MIFIIDDDKIIAKCIRRSAKVESKVFTNAIEAMGAISEGEIPELIFLDILLDGPDGFTFLNEMISYPDTREIPVVVVSSIDFSGRDLSDYGVVGFLNKDKMFPEEIRAYVEKYVE